MAIIFGNYAVKGVDTSEFNLNIDMPTLKKTGSLFNVMRAGYGNRIDPKFKTNWANCKGVLFRMAYWYLDYYSNWYNPSAAAYGMTDFDWGKLQAQNLWAQIKDDNDGVISWLDIESGGSSYSPAITTVWQRVESMMDGFFTELDRLSGRINGVYCSLGLLNNFSAKFKTRPLWVAWYNEYQTPDTVVKMCVGAKGWNNPFMWQYASHGDVNGDGVGDGLTYGSGIRQLDLNIWLKTAEEWAKFSAGGSGIEYPAMAVDSISQNDSRWNNEQLGTSTTTIGRDGCLLACYVARCRQLGKTTDPIKLNHDLKVVGGYESGNLIIHDAITKIYPDITVDWANYLKDVQVTDARMDAMLASKRSFFAQVDFIQATSLLEPHWVVINGKDSNGYTMMDTWDGSIIPLKQRYNKIIRTIVLTGSFVNAGFMVKCIAAVSLNIRNMPNASATVVGYLTNGEMKYVYEVNNGWYKIGEGQWVSGTYMQKINVPVEPPVEVITDAQKLIRLWNAHPELH